MYKIPTLINIKVDLRPCKSITMTRLWTDKILFLKIKKGITIIWETEEYAMSRLKSDWKQQTTVL